MTTEEGRATGDSSSGRRPAQGFLGPRLVAAALLVLAVILIVSALGIRRGGGFTVIPPSAVPLAVAIGLLVIGAIFALRTTVVPDAALAEQATDEERVTHWPTVGLVAVALVGYALALDGFDIGPLDVPGLGYIIATATFLPVTAWILGSRSPIRDVIAGVGIGLVIYFGFTEFLGVRLPAGILGPLL